MPIKDHATTESLKDRIVRAASGIVAKEGYEALSMRRVAQQLGCSQMATYRHFANKEALLQHICGDLYTQFADRVHAEIRQEPDARKKLHASFELFCTLRNSILTTTPSSFLFGIPIQRWWRSERI